jgi:hypothetical protein
MKLSGSLTYRITTNSRVRVCGMHEYSVCGVTKTIPFYCSMWLKIGISRTICENL